MMNKLLIIVISVVLLISCNRRFNNESEFHQWLGNPDNGFVKSKIAGGLKLTLKYLPPEFLVLTEIKSVDNITQQLIDTTLGLHNKSLNFLLTIGPSDENKDVDVMMAGIYNYEEFKERALLMNFDMDKYISLNINDEKYNPVLTNLENTYGLQKHRNLNFVFAPLYSKGELLNAKKYDVVFRDEIFNTGIHHFVFNQEKIFNIPDLSNIYKSKIRK